MAHETPLPLAVYLDGCVSESARTNEQADIAESEMKEFFSTQGLEFHSFFERPDMIALNEGVYEVQKEDSWWLVCTNKEMPEPIQRVDGKLDVKDMATIFKIADGKQFGLFYEGYPSGFLFHPLLSFFPFF